MNNIPRRLGPRPDRDGTVLTIWARLIAPHLRIHTLLGALCTMTRMLPGHQSAFLRHAGGGEWLVMEGERCVGHVKPHGEEIEINLHVESLNGDWPEPHQIARSAALIFHQADGLVTLHRVDSLHGWEMRFNGFQVGGYWPAVTKTESGILN